MSSDEPVVLGISTCPNDTFAFHALLTGEVTTPFPLQIELLDVQQLNERMLQGKFDAAKVSFHAALRMVEDIVVFGSGSALGFGVGPVILARQDLPPLNEHSGGARVLCPGEWTTATLLYRLFHEGRDEAALRSQHVLSQCIFSDIIPALESGEADYGVCIHEGRFVYADKGLQCVEDLGETWERATHAPLPLGGIVGQRRLGADRLRALQQAIHESLLWAREHPEATRPTLRQYAQELDDEVLGSHIELYVNEWTMNLGEQGVDALSQLHRIATERGLIAAETPTFTFVL